MRAFFSSLTILLAASLILLWRWHGRHNDYALLYDKISSYEGITTFGAGVTNYPINAPGKSKIEIQPLNAIPEYKILVTTNSSETFYFQDEVEFAGVVKVPPEFEDFSYKNYLASKGILAVSYTPTITVSKRSGSIFTRIIKGKDEFNTVIRQIYPYKHSLLTSGMLLGVDAGFPKDFKEDLRRAGLLHLVVVSGGNLVFVLTIFYKSLLYLRLNRILSFGVGVCSLLFYSFVVGFEPPVVRALIMTLIVLFSNTLERPNVSLKMLFVAAFAMVFVNPYLLLSASFQLSVGASLGLIVFIPLISKWLRHIRIKGFLVDAGVTTLAAQLGVLPVLLYQFKNFSPLIIFSNMLVSFVPAITTYLGLISGILGLIWLPLGQAVGWANYLCLEYFLLVVKVFS
ncbi:MAG: ComEC/Rec2 family competence protein [bacterium]